MECVSVFKCERLRAGFIRRTETPNRQQQKSKGNDSPAQKHTLNERDERDLSVRTNAGADIQRADR